LEPPEFRNVTLKCLSEIAGLQVGAEYDPKFVILFAMVMTSINKIIPPSTGKAYLWYCSKRILGLIRDETDIAHAYQTSSDSDQELILNLALFLSNFLSNHLRAIENPENKDVLLNAHLYMVKVSQVEEREVFKICLEYWSKLVAELYEEIQSLPMDMNPLLGLNLGGGVPTMLGVPLRKNIYSDVLSNLRLVMIEKMVKPEEVSVLARIYPLTAINLAPFTGLDCRE
jgi:exportin-1